MIISWLFIAFSAFAMSGLSSLSISFTNLKEARGQLFVAVYDSENGFMDEAKARIKKVVPVNQAGTLRLDLGEVPNGTYAVSCFHDVNGNGKLDRNLVGVPTEPYGFSNNARPKFRPPSWKEAHFSWSGKESISVRLEKW